MSKRDLCIQLGLMIRQFRLASGMTPKEFADDIGRDQYFVIELESGRVDVDLLTLDKCAAALNIAVSELITAAENDSAGRIP